MRFKKGDRARFLEDGNPYLTKGKIYTVASMEGNYDVRLVADDEGDAHVVSTDSLKLVRVARKSIPATEPKLKSATSQCGFKNLYIEPPAFAKLLALNGLTFTQRKNANNEFVWGFKDGHIVATNDPLTGTNADGTQNDIGYAEDVGVVGTKSFRDRVAKFLKKYATYNGYDASTRRFV